jgi:hypothetical protein
MALAYDADRHGRPTTTNGSPPGSELPDDRLRPGRSRPANTISASQARAARQRDARRDQLAVAAWLRELARSR